MKTRIGLRLFVITVLAAMLPMTDQAQWAFNFTTTVGNGSFTLSTNNLIPTGDNGGAAGYRDTADTLTFDGITYSNLDFSVYNNSFIVFFNDGFQISAYSSSSSSTATLTLRGWANSSVVAGISPADLITVLSGFDALQGNNSDVFYAMPTPPYAQWSGSITTFNRMLPLEISSPGIQTNKFGFTVTGATGATIVVEACTNLPNAVWFPVQTNVMTSESSYFSDSIGNSPGRFYRVRKLE